MTRVVTLYVGWLTLDSNLLMFKKEPQINQCSDTRRKNESGKLIEPNTGIEYEINSDRGYLLIRGFWDRNTN